MLIIKALIINISIQVHWTYCRCALSVGLSINNRKSASNTVQWEYSLGEYFQIFFLFIKNFHYGRSETPEKLNVLIVNAVLTVRLIGVNRHGGLQTVSLRTIFLYQ